MPGPVVTVTAQTSCSYAFLVSPKRAAPSVQDHGSFSVLTPLEVFFLIAIFFKIHYLIIFSNLNSL